MAALPDLVGSVIEHLRADSDVSTLVSTGAGWVSGSGQRVSGSLGGAWKMPTHAIIVRPAGGPLPDWEVQHQFTRLDVRCYGANAYEALRLWRTVHPVLCPGPTGTNGFTRASCRVLTVAQETGPIPLVEPDTNYPVVVVPYLLRWSELVAA